MIAIFLFDRILTHSNSLFHSLNDLMATVASYFDMHTASAEREVERVVKFQRRQRSRYWMHDFQSKHSCGRNRYLYLSFLCQYE